MFHASYSFTKNNVQEMLKCLKDKVEFVFPSLSELLKMYATLPVSIFLVPFLVLPHLPHRMSVHAAAWSDETEINVFGSDRFQTE